MGSNISILNSKEHSKPEVITTVLALLFISIVFYFSQIDRLILTSFEQNEESNFPELLNRDTLSMLWLGIDTMILTLTAVALPLVSFIVERSDGLQLSWEKKFLLDTVKLQDKFETATIALLFSIISHCFFPTYLSFILALALFIGLAVSTLSSYFNAFRILSDREVLREGGFLSLVEALDKHRHKVANGLERSRDFEQFISTTFIKRPGSIVHYISNSYLVEVNGAVVNLVFDGEQIVEFKESGIEDSIREFEAALDKSISVELREKAQKELVDGEQVGFLFYRPIFELTQTGSADPNDPRSFRLTLQINEDFLGDMELEETHTKALNILGSKIRGFIDFENHTISEFQWENYIDELQRSIDRSLRNRDRSEFKNQMDLLVRLYKRQ